METRALGEESLGFEDGLQAAARDQGDDASHHSAWDFHAPAWATNMSPNLVYFKAQIEGI